MRSTSDVNSLPGEAILHGCKQIAAFLEWTPRQVLYRIETGELPHFRIGQTICARPGTLRAWVAAREAGVSWGAP